MHPRGSGWSRITSRAWAFVARGRWTKNPITAPRGDDRSRALGYLRRHPPRRRAGLHRRPARGRPGGRLARRVAFRQAARHGKGGDRWRQAATDLRPVPAARCRQETQKMRIDRRALLASAAVATIASAVSARVNAQIGLSVGVWRSRRSAELIAIGKSRYRRFTVYDRALALVEQDALDHLEDEILTVQATGEGSLELELWGQVTRFRYEQVPALPDAPRYSDDSHWSSDVHLTMDAFFQLLSEHFAFAAEQGVEWPALRADARRRWRAVEARRRACSRHWPRRSAPSTMATVGWKATTGARRAGQGNPRHSGLAGGGGSASDGDAWDGFIDEGAEHVRTRPRRSGPVGCGRWSLLGAACQWRGLFGADALRRLLVGRGRSRRRGDHRDGARAGVGRAERRTWHGGRPSLQQWRLGSGRVSPWPAASPTGPRRRSRNMRCDLAPRSNPR